MQLSKSHAREYLLPELPEVFWAYLAGFVDGEAHIRKYVVRKTSIGFNYSFELTIAQNRENGGKEIFEWFQRELGAGTIRFRKLEKQEKDVFYFDIRHRKALIKIFPKLIPYSLVKRTRIQLLLDDMKRLYE